MTAVELRSGLARTSLAAVATAGVAACAPASAAPDADAVGALCRRPRAGAADNRSRATARTASPSKSRETPEQQAQGLMYRQSLAPDRGMIFPYDPPGRRVLLDEEHADSARHDFHPPGRDDRADRGEHRADVARPDSVARAGRRRAGNCRRPRGRAWHQGRRQGQLGRIDGRACARMASSGRGAAMGFWSQTFTWWNGATWGTGLFTRLHGEEVGRDDAGNVYFQAKKNPASRWVIYDGCQRRQPGAAGLAGVAQGHDRRSAGEVAPAAAQVREAAERRI